MIRIKLIPKNDFHYNNLDVVKDSFINFLTSKGFKFNDISGKNSKHWMLSVPNPIILKNKPGMPKIGKFLVISTIDKNITDCLIGNLKNINLQKKQENQEINIINPEIDFDVAPVVKSTTFLDLKCLTPIVFRKTINENKQRFITNIKEIENINDIVNNILSKNSGRKVDLKLTFDEEYLKYHPKHSVMSTIGEVNNYVKKVSGLNVLFRLEGSAEDLKLAWHSGIGEHSHYGFGLLGLLEG
jgi:CRISPR-associated endoribonuclease Cas6